MQHFKVRGGQIRVTFGEMERDILSGLFNQVNAVLQEREVDTGHASPFAQSGDDFESAVELLEDRLRALPPPDDPVLARLLPSGRRDDAATAGESAVEFRRLTEPDLRTAKIRDADAAVEFIEDGDIGLDQALALLRALNDVRLSLGSRLGVEEDTPYPRKIRNEVDQAMAIYFWTGGVQEQLLEAIFEIDDDV